MGLDGGYGIGSLKPGVCTSTTRPASPFVGQTIYMTDTDETAVWEGTYWEGLNRAGGRNVVINGAMQVHQRGTSKASITTSGYFTADRFTFQVSTIGTWTQSVESDAPTGSGFRKSLKVLCTTSDASPAADDYLSVRQNIEGQNLQNFLKGTSEAKQFTLSFYVKGNATGTYIVRLFDNDNTRIVGAAYTINSSNTWEKKTITFPADTTGAFDNDNNASLYVEFGLGFGSNRTSGTLSTAWGTNTLANSFSGQTNLAAATNNYWQVTGVQLGAGAVATPFEFEDISTTIEKCQRYFQQLVSHPSMLGLFVYSSATGAQSIMYFPTTMRAAPTVVASNGTNFYIFELHTAVVDFFDTIGADSLSTERCRLLASGNLSGTANLVQYGATNNAAASVAFTAEL